MHVHGARAKIERIEPHHGADAEEPILVVGQVRINLPTRQVLDDCAACRPEVAVQRHEDLVILGEHRTAATPWCLLYATNVAGLRLNASARAGTINLTTSQQRAFRALPKE
jgi:hypothetical protein